MGDMVPKNELVGQGSKGIGGIVGGAVILTLASIGAPIPSLIVGGIVGIVGLAMSSSHDDRKAGLLVAGVGGLTAISAIGALAGIAGTILTISGIGLSFLMNGFQNLMVLL